MKSTRRVYVRFTVLTLMAVFIGVFAGCRPENSTQSATAEDETVRVVTSGGFTAAYDQLAPLFEAETGIRLITEYGASTGGAYDSIPMRLDRNELFDIVILSRPALDDLVAAGKADPDSRTDLANSRIGMSIRAGAETPDISTRDAFLQVLREADSIGYSASVSGTYLSQSLWPELGIWEEIESRSVRVVGERVAAVVARGDLEIGFQQISEILPIPGAELAGPIPEEFQRVTMFSAGMPNGAENQQGARRLLDFLSSAAVAPQIAATGMEPVAGSQDIEHAGAIL